MAPEKSPANVDFFKGRLLQFFRDADARLQGRDFLAEELNIADLALYPIYAARKGVADRAGDLPNLTRWGALMAARPGVIKGLAATVQRRFALLFQIMNQRTGFRALAVNLRALASCFLFLATPLAAEPSFDVIRDEIANHPGQTGAFVLDTGEEALLARAWLVNHAESSIEVQYFILSTDNVGILASEALLRATCQKNSRPQYVTRSKGHRNLSRATPPVFALHAETVVVDGEITYIGSFNLDPRSQNLSTEVGLVVRAPMFARRVQTAIEEDMLPANS